MAVLHRALFTWFSTLLFLIFLGLRLDEKTSWNFFIVFCPMWVFDFVLLLYVSIRFAAQCRSAVLIAGGPGHVNGGSGVLSTATSLSSTAGSSGHRGRQSYTTSSAAVAIGSGPNVARRSSGRRTAAWWLTSMSRKSCFLVGVLLKMTFQAAVCVRLEYPDAKVPLHYVFVPLWLLLSGLCVDVFRDLVQMCRY